MSTPCILIISSGFIAGIPHRNPDLTKVEIKDALNIVLEPENPHDPRAIKLIHVKSAQFLGYVPREQTQALHVAIGHGFQPSAFITELNATKWKEVAFSVFIEAALTENSTKPHVVEEPKTTIPNYPGATPGDDEDEESNN